MTTVITGADKIALVQLIAQRGALKLEIAGMTRRGRSVSAMLKDHHGWKGNKATILKKLEELIEQKKAELQSNK